jgi:hypothetical protein
VLHTATVAVDTDNELLSIKFGNNTTLAVNYLAGLFAAMNVMYERDLLIRLRQGYTVLRPSTTPDPWIQPPTAVGPDVGRASQQQLNEFAAYWAANFGGVKRAAATLLSGKQPDANTSGYSFVGVLCSTQAVGGAYNFNQVYTSSARPAGDDAREVGHEIGHNFGTRHTHCHLPTPADQCWSGEGTGCYSGVTSCPAPATYGGIPNVRGTVMSWCDRRPENDCPVTNVFHPTTVAILQPRIDTAVGTCIFPFVPGAPPPAPSAIDPPIGHVSGGASVTITGTNFVTGASASLVDANGSAPLTGVTVVNATTLTGTTTAHAAGVMDLAVMNPDQQIGTLGGVFSYRQHPTIASISPNGGPETGGTPVTIMGTGFVSPATLTLGGVPATGVSVVSSTILTGVTAAHPVGIVDVAIGMQGGLGVTAPGSYFYMPVIPPVAFFTLAPCRVVDTRRPNDPLGGPILAAASARIFDLDGVCGLPAGAKAVSVNLTVVGPANPGYLTLYPADGLRPLASNLNFSAGQIRANNAMLVLATDGSGRLTVFNGSGGTAHFILDINGYYQ